MSRHERAPTACDRIFSAVGPNWNSANDFIVYGKGGDLATNRLEDQELAMLALHLLQISLVYTNTLIIQRVLAGTCRKFLFESFAEAGRVALAETVGHVASKGPRRLRIHGTMTTSRREEPC